MRHLRLSVTAAISVIVALATIGSLSVASHPHHTGRRRSHAVRVTRVGAQRLDHPEGVTHEFEQHDPVLAIAAAGVADLQQTVVALPRTADRAPHVGRHVNAAPPGLLPATSVRIVPHRAVRTLAFERAASTRLGAPRLSRGRAPPRFV